MATIYTVYGFVAKRLSYWSMEFSALITVSFALLSLGLLDIWVIKTILTISMFLFFAGVVHKFILAVYKQQIDVMNKIKICSKKSLTLLNTTMLFQLDLL